MTATLPDAVETIGWSRPHLAVVGAGRLGLTAAHAALTAGFAVTLLTRAPATSGTQRAAVATSLQREVRRGALSAEAAVTLLERLTVTADRAALAAAEVVIEAVPEDLEAKRALIGAVEAVVAPDCLIASSTSSIPAGWLAAHARHPGRVVVTHYIWPAHRMPLVEVALHSATTSSARMRLDALLAAQDKTVVRVADRPGFLITRALLAYWNAAVELVMEGREPVEVDEAVESFGLPLGPLRMMDAAGLTTAAAVQARVTMSTGKHYPGLNGLPAVLDRGLTGFYEHRGEHHRPLAATAATLRRRSEPPLHPAGRLSEVEIVDRVVGPLGREVDRAVGDGAVASWSEAGRAVDLALGFPRARGGLHAWWSQRGTEGDAERRCAATPGRG